MIVAVGTVLVAFFIRCHILPEGFLALLAQERHFDRLF